MLLDICARCKHLGNQTKSVIIRISPVEFVQISAYSIFSWDDELFFRHKWLDESMSGSNPVVTLHFSRVLCFWRSVLHIWVADITVPAGSHSNVACSQAVIWSLPRPNCSALVWITPSTEDFFLFLNHFQGALHYCHHFLWPNRRSGCLLSRSGCACGEVWWK